MADTSFQDRVLIREIYGRYALAAAQQNGPAWLACWSRDATWKTPQFEVTGQAALEQTWAATWTMFSHVSAFNEVGEIVVTGDSAIATCIVLELITLAQGGSTKMVGLYEDHLVKEDGAWRFSRRHYRLLSQE